MPFGTFSVVQQAMAADGTTAAAAMGACLFGERALGDLHVQMPIKRLGSSLQRQTERTFLDARPLTGFMDAGHEPAASSAVCNSHEDFLFGTSSCSGSKSRLQRHFTSKASGVAESDFGLVRPAAFGKRQPVRLMTKQAMMGALLPPEIDKEDEEPEKGWCKIVPRCLMAFGAIDIASAMVLFLTRNTICDFPLRKWIIGGLLLGFPASALVDRAAKSKPKYSIYKFTALELRGGGSLNEMQIGGLALFRQGNRPVESKMAQEPDASSGGKSFRVTLDFPELVTSYQVISSHGDESKDPLAWQLEGSNDGLVWYPVDVAEEPDFPRARGQASTLYEELLHLNADNDNSFRQAFYLEVGMTSLALVWLMAGTSWASSSSEACIDSAPTLWVYCFSNIVFTWSGLGTITVGLIVSAVVMIALGAKAG